MDKMPPGVMGGTYAGNLTNNIHTQLKLKYFDLFLLFLLFLLFSLTGNALACAAALATLDIFQEGEASFFLSTFLTIF